MFTTIGTRAQPPDDSSVHAGLRVVRVEDVDALAPEDVVQLARGAHVGERIRRPGRRSERNVADALAFEHDGMRAGRADADRLPARVAYRAQLGEEKEAQTHVDGREVRNLERSRAASGIWTMLRGWTWYSTTLASKQQC